MSLGLQIESPSLARLNRRFAKIAKTFPTQGKKEMLEIVGALVESQTRRRLSTEKTDPSGKKWLEWSDEYAGSKHGRDKSHDAHPGQLRASQGHSILELSGDLIDSIQFAAGNEEVTVGSNLPYAGVQNAARQYIGLSRDNEDEIEATVDDFLDDFLKLDIE